MKFVIDGPNNVGKSTLITELKHRFDYEVYHIIKDATFEKFNMLFKVKNAIFDRGPISELVYSEIYGRNSNLTLKQVEALMTSDDLKSYVLIKPKQVIYENYKHKHEENSNECNDEFIDKELELFIKYAKLTNSKIITSIDEISHN